MRDNVAVFELEAQGDDLLSQTGEVVLVSSADLFDHAVVAKPFHQPGDLAVVFGFHAPAQVLVLKATDIELAGAQCRKQRFAFRIEKVEAAPGSIILLYWLRDLVIVPDALAVNLVAPVLS